MTAAPLLEVPLIGAMATGLLGVPGLPRLWQKASLAVAGTLSPSRPYPDAAERAMLHSAGIAFSAFDDHMRQLPAYLEAEAWIAGKAGAMIPAERSGDGGRLENLCDLDVLHAFVTNGAGGRDVAVTPAVSGLLAGELGLLHLPRLWAKAMIDLLGLLPEGYHSGKGPLDEQCAAAIGFDLAAAIRYVRSTRPRYAAFEAWISEHAMSLDDQTRETWNTRIATSMKPEHVAAPEREQLGITDPNERRGPLLNHLVDMHYFHLEVLAL